MSPIEFFELPQGTPSIAAVVGTPAVAYCSASDVASLNKSRAGAWGLLNEPTLTDVNGYIMMTAGQIDAVLVNKGYSVPVNVASYPEVEGLLAYVNAQGAAWMVEEASPSSRNVDRVKLAFDAAMDMLKSAEFALDVPTNDQRAKVRAPFVSFQPTGDYYDPTLQSIGGQRGDGISGQGIGCPRDPYFSRQMRF